MLQVMTPVALLMATGSILLGAFALSGGKFVQLVRRTRWVMLSLLVIYAYSTPGQPLSDVLGVFSPSREGVSDGVVQLARLLAALAGLAILLERLHRQQLIAGLYTIFAPLHWLGMSRERAAVRLALTLHYAELAMLRGRGRWQDILGGLFEQHHEATRQIELPLYRFSPGDAWLMAAALLMLWLVWR